MRSTAWRASAAGALVIGACGGGGDDRKPATTPGSAAQQPTPTPQPDDPAAEVELDQADVRIVREWADSLRRGQVRAAARYFALPSLVANGTPPVQLTTRAQTRSFNRALPCGAKLIRSEPAARGFFIATFRLTERPGAGECGSGTGATARTAFRVRGARITEWLRVQDVDSAPDTLS